MSWFKNELPRLAVLMVLMGASLMCIAQSPQFKKIQVASRISEQEVYKVGQDSLGYLWLGTNQGIYRFDGVSSKGIDMPDSLKSIRSTSLYIGLENIYFGLENGILININKRPFAKAEIIKMSDAAITAITIDQSGQIWAGTNGSGIAVLHDGKVYKFTTNDGLPDDYIHAVEYINHQVATATDLGLSICRFENDKFTFRNFDRESGLTDNMVMTVKSNGDNNLLLGMENGSVCNLNLENNRIDEFNKFNEFDVSPIEKILKLDEDLLIITESDGAFVLNWNDRYSIQQFQLVEEGKPLRRPKDAIVDSEGNLVLAFGDNELTIADFRIQYIRFHDNESFADASCVMADREGNIWLANDNGIFRHQGQFATDQELEIFYKRAEGESNIITLCEGNDHDIWFGTFGHGLGRIDIRTKKISRFTEKNNLVNNNILTLAKQGNTLWMATLGGAGTLQFVDDKPVFTTYDAKSPLKSNFVYTVFVDSKERVWLGTDGNGLVMFENNEFKFLNSKFADAGKSVTAITEDEHGNIWFNSTDVGLQWTDLQNVYSIKMNTKNEKVEIFTIHSDAFGNVVVLTSAGLAVLNNHIKNITYIKTGFDILSNYLNVISRDISGHMWLCTKEAMIRYNDFNLGRNLKPRTYIDGLEVMLQSVDTSRHTFRFDENHITFDITSIWFQEPEAVSYQYRLIGYDSNWVTTRDRKVIFSQLRPGNYTFEVRSSTNEFWDDAEIDVFAFEIMLPYYRKTWFILTCIILIIGIVTIILRMRFQRLRRNEAIAREKVQSQFDTLRNQVNPHFLFNSFNTLNSIISQDQSAAISYVEKLSDYFRIVLEQRDKDVISVKEELALVKNYLYLQQQRFGQNLTCNINISTEIGSSLIPPLTIQLLTENAIKHNIISKSRPLTITISEEGNMIIISNNLQPKLTKEHSTGIGLDNIRHRYRILFSKEIIISETSDHFQVKLPIVGIKRNDI